MSLADMSSTSTVSSMSLSEPDHRVPQENRWEERPVQWNRFTNRFNGRDVGLRLAALSQTTLPRQRVSTTPMHRSPNQSFVPMTANGSFRRTITTASLPELSTGGNSRTESSICTDDASRVRGYNSDILETNEEGALSQNIPERPAIPRFPCCFSFLRCNFSSPDLDEWETHCRFHFCGHPPPRRVQCPYCDNFRPDSSDPWESRMHHIADHHIRDGPMLPLPRPDFSLFEYLWQKRIINEAQRQELTRNHILSNGPSYYTITQGASIDERRRSEQHRERRRGDRRAGDLVMPRARRDERE